MSISRRFSLFLAAFLALAALSIGNYSASAASAVTFLSPADGSSAAVGTSVTPTGQATATGAVGGLDLVIVIDVSGSTFGERLQAEIDAAKALINALPAASTSVGVVAFSSTSRVVAPLTPLSGAGAIAALEAAVNGLSAGGGTVIGSGIDRAATLLTPGDPTRTQQMIVMSDGFTSGDPSISAANAIAAGVDSVHSVALPGASIATMQAIATAGNGVFTDLTTQPISNLPSIFDGTGGNLVGLDRIDITLPDGTVLQNIAFDGLGNFTVPQAFMLALGANVWQVDAFFDDGSQRTAFLTVNGTIVSGEVPIPAAAPLMLSAITGLGVIIRRRRRKASQR